MFWVLLVLLLLASLAVLGATLLVLWKRVKVLGGQVTAAGATVGELTSGLDRAKATGPLGAQPCPTCGAPPRLVGSRSPAVRPAAR